MKPLVNARRGIFVLMLTAVCVYPVESARILNEPDGFNGQLLNEGKVGYRRAGFCWSKNRHRGTSCDTQIFLWSF